MHELMDKLDGRKIELFRYLENQATSSSDMYHLMDILEMSEFVVKKTINELNQDFSDFNLENVFQIIVEDNKVELYESGQATSDLLGELYVKQSISFNILKDIFFGRFTSVTKYSMENFTSVPTVYKNLKLIQENLNDAGIQLTKKYRIEGDELTIRFYFYSLFSKIYKNNFSIYLPDQVYKIETLITELEKKIGRKISPVGLIKIKHYLLVTQQCKGYRGIRNIEQDDYRWQELSIYVDSPLMPVVYNYFFEYILTNDIAVFETNLFLTSLNSESLLGLNYINKLAENKRLKCLTDYFLEELESSFKNAYQNIDLKALKKDLDMIHIKVAYFDFSHLVLYRNVDLSYIQENYPEFLNFCRSMIMRTKDRSNLFDIWENRIDILYAYVFILINHITLDLFMPVINVCVDFSLGKPYNRFIIDNLNTLVSMNTNIESSLSEKTDILLTDVFMDKMPNDVVSVVWHDPPKANDWANLGDILTRIKKDKYNDR